MYNYFAFTASSIVPTFKQLFPSMLEATRLNFFDKYISPEEFTSSMQTATDLAVKIQAFNETGSVVITEVESAWLDKAFDSLTIALNTRLSEDLSADVLAIETEHQQNKVAFERFKSHIHVEQSESVEV